MHIDTKVRELGTASIIEDMSHIPEKGSEFLNGSCRSATNSSKIEEKVFELLNETCRSASYSEDMSKVEEKISEFLNDSCQSTKNPSTSTLSSELLALTKQQIRMIGASPTGSIIVFFICTTFRSVVSLKEMIQTERLQEIMERIFNMALKSTIQLNLRLSHDEDQFKHCIDEARRTSKNESMNSTNCIFLNIKSNLITSIIFSNL